MSPQCWIACKWSNAPCNTFSHKILLQLSFNLFNDHRLQCACQAAMFADDSKNLWRMSRRSMAAIVHPGYICPRVLQRLLKGSEPFRHLLLKYHFCLFFFGEKVRQLAFCPPLAPSPLTSQLSTLEVWVSEVDSRNRDKKEAHYNGSPRLLPSKIRVCIFNLCI